MEIDITEFFRNGRHASYSASRAELGDDAGQITWANAVDASDEFNILDNEEKREAFRAWVREFGAWTEDEINAWSDAELNALCLQFVAGYIREFPHAEGWDWDEYSRLASEGQVSGNLYPGADGRVYFYCGN